MKMPDSEMNYPGARADRAFVATEPYVLNIMGSMTPSSLEGAPRTHDFSGGAPFVNPATGKADPWMIQAWDPAFAASFDPPLSGTHDLENPQITNAGFPGRVDKRVINGEAVTMVRYNAGDGITEGKDRSQLNSWAVPPRTHVRWELEVAFGNADGVNDWTLTPPGSWIFDGTDWVLTPQASPVLFWQLRLKGLSIHPALAAHVDTDATDPTKLMILFAQKRSDADSPVEIARVNGIPRHTQIPIVIEAFLDERQTAQGGKGMVQIWVGNKLVVEKAGPTLSPGRGEHSWQLDAYLWNEARPYRYTRSVFWKTARMIVFPAKENAASASAQAGAQ